MRRLVRAGCCKNMNAVGSRQAGPPGLVSLASGVGPLASAFNTAKDRPRFVAILSPTCSACVHGAEAVKAAVLPASPALEVFVVWSPMLGGDSASAAATSSAIVTAPQVHQYWDPERRVGTALRKDVFPDAVERMKRSVPKDHFIAEHLRQRDGGQPEWDIYLLFPPGSDWKASPPAPSSWVRQVVLFNEPSPVMERQSLLWRNDYAQAPIEGSLVEELRKLVASVRAARLGAAR